MRYLQLRLFMKPTYKLRRMTKLTISLLFAISILVPTLGWGQVQTLTFTANGTWTVPCGVTSVTVTCWGGGGGGAGDGGSSATTGGGGSSGGMVTSTIAVVSGTSIAYTIGAGGAGGCGGGGGCPAAGGPGGPGGITTFSTVSALGGNGGAANNGAGGTAVVGGSAGTSGANNVSGAGGAGFGPGGVSVTSDGNGNTPTPNSAAGGSGANNVSGSTNTGGSGGSGRIIITWTGPYAGPDQALAACATSTSLAANTPSGAGSIGTWTCVSGCSGVTFSNANSPTSTVNGLTPGTNTVLQWTWSGGGAGCISSNDQVTLNTAVGLGCQVYCNPSGIAPGSSTYGQIRNVTFNTINNSSTGTTSGFQNFYPAQITSVTAGATYPLSISGTATAGGSPYSLQPNCVMAYFDFNGDGDFSDSGEAISVGSFATTSTAVQTINTNVTIPATATVGYNLAFFVEVLQGACPMINPCPASGNGQAEQYGIFVSSCNMTVPNAGLDQNLGSCITSATLAGNPIANGTGQWVLVSGTGIITAPSSPTSTVTNLGPGANEFMWVGTPTNPLCPELNDNVIINTTNLPTVANAGVDLETCNSSIALAGNTPVVGTGLWTIVAGPGSVSAPASNPTATLSGLVSGSPTTLQWTITSGSGCVSSDQVVVTMISAVTAANAGPDQAGCTGSAIILAGNNPANGVGTWTGASGIIADPSNPTSAVNALNSVGTYSYTWTVSAPGCASSVDVVNINIAFCDANVTTVTCPGPITFTDGAGTQYANNEHIVQKYCPSSPGQYITATFTEVAFNNLLDHMIVLNGSSYSSPVIDDFYSIPTINGGAGTITSSASDGCLTFIFLSNATGTANGWTASISCTATPSAINTPQCNSTNCLGGCLRTICGVPATVPFQGDGIGVEELNAVDGGCLAGGEMCSNWFLINPTSAGTLTLNMFVNSGQDQDFAVWEAYDPLLECPAMTGEAPILCNFAGATAQGTGFNSTLEPTNAAYEPSLNISAAQVSAGLYYIILVNTFNNGGACPQPNVSVTFGGTAGISCNPPIVLGDEKILLSGINEGNRNYLSWQVEDEQNTSHYSVERSKNGTEWSVLGVRASHKSSTGSEYYMYDEAPHTPFTYYRVKQISVNGEEKSSEIITISTGDIGEFWVSELFPNPTSEEVSFQYQANDDDVPVNVEVYNTIGQLVVAESFNIQNMTGVTIATSRLAIGTYHVRISQGELETVKKLSIMR